MNEMKLQSKWGEDKRNSSNETPKTREIFNKKAYLWG